MKNLFKFILVFLVTFASSRFADAQGAWLVSNSNPSFPRIVCTKDSLNSIRSNLLLEPQKSIYNSVYARAMSSVPVGNTSDSERRNRGMQCKNAAYAFLMNRKIVGNSILIIPTNERDSILKHTLVLLNTMNTGIDSITFTNLTAYDSWQWRSKELINYDIAYDCLKGALVQDSLLVLAKNNLQLFTGNLLKECNKNFLGNSFWTFNKNNFALIMCAALGTSAIVINDATSNNVNYQPSAWLYCALARTDSLLWYDANKKSIKGKMAGYAESPTYFLYSLQHLNSFFIGLHNYVNDKYIFTNYAGNIKNILQPLHDSDYDILFDWLFLIRMPDGRVPAIDDTYMDAFNTQLALTGKRKYYTRNYYSKLSRFQNNSFISSLYGADDYNVNFLGLNYTQFNDSLTETPTQVLKDAGNIVFRSGWDSMANYMHLTCESGIPRMEGGGHNQADEMSFVIESKGQLLALDAGYIQYNQRSLVCQASNHNMILVDGQGTVCGSPGNSGGADVSIIDAFTSPGLDYSETQTNYGSADITRCAMMLDKKYFAFWDFASASNNKNFTWQLHGYGMENGNDSLGYFTDSTQSGFATWRKNGVTLQANIVSKDAVINYRKAKNIHELSYNQAENHTTLLADVNLTKNVLFASVLYPSSLPTDTIQNTPNLITVKNGSTKAYFSLFNEKESKIKGMADAVYCKLEEDSVKMVFARNFSQLERYNANSADFTAKDFVVSAFKPCNIVLENPLTQKIDIYINKANTINLVTYYQPYSVKGSSLVSWRMGPNNILEIITNGEGKLQILCNSTPLVHVGVNMNHKSIATLKVGPNPTDDYVKIESEISIQSLKLYNATGLMVSKSNDSQISLQSLPSGFYFLVIQSKDGRLWSRKIQRR